MPIVWPKTDGSVLITVLEERFLDRNRLSRETAGETVLRLAEALKQKIPAFQGLKPLLVKSADLPQDRTQRHAWRVTVSNGIPKVVIDPIVPPPPLSAKDQARIELLALDPKAVKPEDLPGIVERLQKVL